MKTILIAASLFSLSVLAQQPTQIQIVNIKLSNNKLIALNFNDQVDSRQNLNSESVSITNLKENGDLLKILELRRGKINRNFERSSGSGWQPEKNNSAFEMSRIMNQITSNSDCKKSDLDTLASEFNTDITLDAAEMSDTQLTNLAKCLLK